MAPARKSRQTLAERTPIAEWVAAAAGLALTLAIVGYTLWEGVTRNDGPPRLSIETEPAAPTPNGFVLPIVVKNSSRATAAAVSVVGRLRSAQGLEERRARFTYVPGRGEARGALVFQANPETGDARFEVEGFAEP